MTMGKIVVIGSANVDFIMKMARLPMVGETVTDAHFMQAFGGKGANQALSAAQAGGDVWFVGCVGADEIGVQMKQTLQQRGVHVEHLVTTASSASGTALILIGAAGENMIAVAPGANHALTPAMLAPLESLIATAALVILQCELRLETVEAAIVMAGKYKCPVLLNLAPAGPLPNFFLSGITYLVVNESEAAFLCGFAVQTMGEVAQAADLLLGRGVQTVLITLGAQGVYMATASEQQHIPAFAVTAVDSTAAGDVFCGCLGAALVAGRPLPVAVQFANAAAAICVTRLGAQPSIPHRDEIEMLLASGN